MKVLFTIWAKVGVKSNGKEEHRGTQRNTENGRFEPEKLDEKNSSKYLHIKIIVYLCGMKTKTKSVMNKELVALLAIIATGATCAGILLGGATLAVVGATMYLIPIYVAILGNRYF